MSTRTLHLALLGLVVLLGGCRGCPSKRPPIHLNPNMDNQPKYLAQAESGFFADGAAMRRPVAGTVAQGNLREDRAFWEGIEGAETPVTALPVPVDDRLLARGEERYGVFCAPCHGDRGDGRGMLFRRSQIESANLHDERIRQLSPGQMFDVITHGLGLMPGYAPQIPVEDRWAIVAFVEQLQREAGVEPTSAEPIEPQPEDEPANGAASFEAPPDERAPAEVDLADEGAGEGDG